MDRMLHWLDRIESGLAGLAYAVCVGVLLADVLMREFMGAPLWGSQKIATYAAVVAGIIGLTLAVGKGEHFRIALADRILPFGWVTRISHAVSALLFGTLTVAAVYFVAESYTFADRAPVINIPLWPILSCFPVAFCTATLKHLIFLMRPDLDPTEWSL